MIDEIPIDFPDPATWETDFYWLEYLATMWMASGTVLPPTIEEIQWRDVKLDKEIAAYRMMLEFYTKMDKRPSELQGAFTEAELKPPDSEDNKQDE